MGEVREYLLTISGANPLLRKLMSTEEIKEANKLVKEGKMVKGTSEDKPHTVIYYCEM